MSEAKNTVKEISELGEFGLIRHLTSDLKIRNSSTILGVGDDAALLDYSDKQIVVTTDLLTEGVHFDLVYTPLKHLGYKAAIVNFSDVYAMNAIPKQITVSIALSAKFSVNALDEFYSGLKLACDRYNVDIIGGDTSSSLTGLTISITAIGEVKKDKVVFRNGAKETDLICVSGNLGAAYLGLLLLKREKEVYNTNPEMQPQLKGYDYILERHLKPEAREDIIRYFEENDLLPTSMIDISDGLSSEILHICQQSEVGCRIYEEKIPIDIVSGQMAEEFHIVASTAALNGGEDYELLFTLPIGDYDKVKDHPDISIIGHITAKDEGRCIVAGDEMIDIKAQGWNTMTL